MEERTLARLGQIRERLAYRTPGEWAVTHYSGGLSFNGFAAVYCGMDNNYGEPLRIPSAYNSEADCALIANAPNDLKFLLGLVEELLNDSITESERD